MIEEDYFHEVDADQLESESVRSLVDQLKKRYKDRFSHYFTPDEYERFREGAASPASGWPSTRSTGAPRRDRLQANACEGGRHPAR